jgi:hypothetical protein
MRYVCASVLLAAGCDFGDPTTAGELGNGEFRYICAGANDAACDQNDEAFLFPEVLAVGGRFALDYEARSGPTARIEPAAPVVLAESGDVLEFLRAGSSAVLAIRGDAVVDVVHLEAQEIDEAVVTVDVDTSSDRDGVRPQVDLFLDEQAHLTLELRDVIDRLLSGSVDLQWSTSDAAVFEVVSLPTKRDVLIEARGTGAAELILQVETFAASFPVNVAEAEE